jgi:excisionase family DNA binding protein
MQGNLTMREYTAGETIDETPLLDSGGLLTVKEAAAATKLSRSFLYQQMDAGRLVYARFGRARRIPKAELEKWMSAHLQGGWAQSPPSLQ